MVKHSTADTMVNGLHCARALLSKRARISGTEAGHENQKAVTALILFSDCQCRHDIGNRAFAHQKDCLSVCVFNLEKDRHSLVFVNMLMCLTLKSACYYQKFRISKQIRLMVAIMEPIGGNTVEPPDVKLLQRSFMFREIHI